MQDREHFEGLFLTHLESIKRIIASLCRRYGMTGDDADDFDSWVKLRLVEDDYAVFQKFRGESSVATYLTVVIAMLARDYRVQQWGRWRPSAAARQRGPLALRLEALVYRDGHSYEEAAQLLRTSGEATLSDRELRELFAAIPARQPLRPRPAGQDPLQSIPAASGADEAVVRHDLETSRTHAEGALDQSLRTLSAEDQVILRLRYWEGLTVADISRTVGVPQKPLYRRLERSLALLREQLEAARVTWEEIEPLLGAPLLVSDADQSGVRRSTPPSDKAGNRWAVRR
jgi:RNA polymerase sigma factor for flagellar operon FliA